eukprot:m.476179 g.476179  ORF g.476179 m.476179 type:complete len:161 (+) comp20460_c0_seq1:69-551(+)
MGKTHGLRRGTRYMFSREFKQKGRMPLSTYLKQYKRGDIVDIKGNGAIHKGMPHKVYHGKTGVVYNVTARAVGVVVNKKVRGTILAKRINVRVEHVKHSKCREDFLRRVAENDAKKVEARKTGVKVALKREPVKPRTAHTVDLKNNPPQEVNPIAYEFLA